MSIFKDFEIDVLRRLGEGVLSARQITQLSEEGELTSLNFSGSGYLLTVRHNSLVLERRVLNHPIISGAVGDLLTGFVKFVEKDEVTLECFSYGGEVVPQNVRDLEVHVTH
ncbi:hypothetical protein J7426_07295 [Tropicibacter sp. R16_0]|uniref:hypothetical protein n=1 Tax=Tropicibacter sp. R16_0 TaxID=2821102 RepID=UPI001ADAF293|nr:hypothetical protein [Tropicibacter sp. R16_0]MBO9450054.1 hypothetical protein [Tropicibacter sp. R16_0]